MGESETELKAAGGGPENTLSSPRPRVEAKEEARSGSRRSVPWRSAWEVIKETVEGVDQLEVPLRAAAVSYYGLLAIFPLLLFLISLGTSAQVVPKSVTRV